MPSSEIQTHLLPAQMRRQRHQMLLVEHGVLPEHARRLAPQRAEVGVALVAAEQVQIDGRRDARAGGKLVGLGAARDDRGGGTRALDLVVGDGDGVAVGCVSARVVPIHVPYTHVWLACWDQGRKGKKEAKTYAPSRSTAASR